MAEDYVLVRDIIYDHNARMLNIKKYYPYFKLMETDFSQFQGGKYIKLDMGYILMAVLRFFIEENNFKEKDVTYEEYEKFIHEVFVRDFEIVISEDEEKELSLYIFDKIKNDGKPFVYRYFDPSDKTSKVIRMRIIDSHIRENNIIYNITSEAIEFYLDTKEIKDESAISVAQLLLEKMINSRNFKGGTDVIKRINSEVSRLKIRKNEVLNILSYDVFEGIKAYEDFVNTGIRWFDDEQKLFTKNMELIKETIKITEDSKEIYDLETELKKSILKHGELLNMCTELQRTADELISGAKLKKLRRSFSFEDGLKKVIEKNDMSYLDCMIIPLLKLNIKKSFSLESIDRMLTLLPGREESPELIKEKKETEYIYSDEIEESRISDNFKSIITELLNYINEKEEFESREFNDHLISKFGESIIKNGDYYSMLIHINHKKEYDLEKVMEKPDTFFEEHLCNVIKESNDDNIKKLKFTISPLEGNNIEKEGVFEMTNIQFKKVKTGGNENDI